MLQESRIRKFTVVAVLMMIGTTLLTSASLQAALIARYDLLDHPNGNETPPPYGLRLDNMGSVAGEYVLYPGILPRGKYLFSAELNESHLTLDVIEDDMTELLSMHIYGTMYGGLQDDTNLVDHLDAIFRGPVVVDFTYRENVITGPGAKLFTVTDDAHDLTDGNTGTIEWTDGNGDTHTIYLQDQKGKKFSARLAFGHRTGPDTLSFWGWVNHSTGAGSGDYPHMYSSDWLLTASPVPEPATVICLGIGAAAAGLARRRRQRAKTSPDRPRSP